MLGKNFTEPRFITLRFHLSKGKVLLVLQLEENPVFGDLVRGQSDLPPSIWTDHNIPTHCKSKEKQYCCKCQLVPYFHFDQVKSI